MLEIDAIRLENLPNGAHFTYHKNTIARAKADSVISTKFAKFLTPYDASFLLEDKALKISQKSFLSDEIAVTDKLRDDLLRGLRKTVESMAALPVATLADAAKVVAQNIKDYNIDPTGQLDKETGLLQNLVSDRKGANADKVATLGLTEVVEQLDAANEKVNQLIEERNDAYALREVGAMRAARLKVDDAYRKLVQVINAFILVEGEADYKSFVDKQNESIKRYKQQVLGQTSGGKKPDEGGDEPTPVTPEITKFYPKENANPDKPLEFPRNKTAVLEGKGLKLVDSPEGKKAQLVLINYVEQRMPHEDSAILLNTDEKIEFTMMYDAAEGQYNFQIETYPNGTEEAVIIKYPETITLV